MACIFVLEPRALGLREAAKLNEQFVMERETYCALCNRDLISLEFCGGLAFRTAWTFLWSLA